MTVVITHLDDIKEDVDEPQRQKLEIAEQKITDLVELTDKVRQINATLENGAHPSSTVNLASLVNCRVAALREEYPCATIDLDVPGTASVYADEKFGLVIDNIVESAVTYGKSPSISISISGHGNEIRLQIDDRNGSIPNSDLAAIENGIETALEHGYGMELWLVYWLVEHTGGTLTIETDGVGNRITITLQRVREVVIDY